MDPRPAPPRSRLPIYLVLGAATVGGYYLYSAGGSVKQAEKEFERDAARLSSTVKSELPGRGKVLQKDVETATTNLGAKFDHTVDEAKRGLYNAEAKIEQYGKETGKDLQKKIDETDKKIEQKAAQTKSSISSFFSSGNK